MEKMLLEATEGSEVSSTFTFYIPQVDEADGSCGGNPLSLLDVLSTGTGLREDLAASGNPGGPTLELKGRIIFREANP